MGCDHLAGMLGVGTPQTWRTWIRRCEVDGGQRPGVMGDAESSAGLGYVADLGSMLKQADATVVHNVFVDHGMASSFLDLNNPETAYRDPHLCGGWPREVSPPRDPYGLGTGWRAARVVPDLQDRREPRLAGTAESTASAQGQRRLAPRVTEVPEPLVEPGSAGLRTALPPKGPVRRRHMDEVARAHLGVVGKIEHRVGGGRAAPEVSRGSVQSRPSETAPNHLRPPRHARYRGQSVSAGGLGHERG